MPTFEPRTFSDFFKRMAQRVVARTELSDLKSGGNVATILGGVARELDEMSDQMVALKNIWDIDKAEGEDLDGRAADVNPDQITRLLSIASIGTAKFRRNGSVGAVTIPQGTEIAVSGGTPVFTTTSAGTILNGNTDQVGNVGIVALEPGTRGNIAAGLWATEAGGPLGVTEFVTPVAGVDFVKNDTACIGGQLRESDPQLRARIKAYLRSLPRGTPEALRAAVLGLAVTGRGRITTSYAFEGPVGSGWTIVYVDDGSGTIEDSENTGGVPEAIVTTASGGEERVFLGNHAVVPGSTVDLVWTDANNVAGGGAGAQYSLVRWTAGAAAGTYDYVLNEARGHIILVPLGPSGLPDAATSPFSVAGLQPGDDLTAEYTWFVGLISEAQKVIDGDPSDRENYPGYRASGTYVQVLAPTVYWRSITGVVTLDKGYTLAAVLIQVISEMTAYVNGLGINGDMYHSELVHAAQSVDGVRDIQITDPPGNVLVGESELNRISSDQIDLVGA